MLSMALKRDAEEEITCRPAEPMSGDEEYDRPLGHHPEPYPVDPPKLAVSDLLCKRSECRLGDDPDKNGADKKGVHLVRCFQDLITYSRAWQYKNVQKGMILFRGSKTYESEKSTLLRVSERAARRSALKRLLQMVRELRSYYEKNNVVEGAMMMEDTNSIASTVRALALLQHYSNVALVKTPMLDVTKDVRVAASFAFQGELKPKLNRCVRFLLVGKPRPVEELGRSRFWKGQMEEENNPLWLIQRLGESEMLLVELQSLLPASAMRPQNQSGYFLVHERDLIACHTLLQKIKGNSTDQQLDKLVEKNEADQILGDNRGDETLGWDALHYPSKSMVIPDDVQPADFFHLDNFPQLETDQLYPNRIDPMMEVIDTCVERLNERNEQH